MPEDYRMGVSFMRDISPYMPEIAQQRGYTALWYGPENVLVLEDWSGREWDQWAGVAGMEDAVYILQSYENY